MLRRVWMWGLCVVGIQCATAGAASPYLMLGPADEMALDQPRVAIELRDPTTGNSLGPTLANTFLLDTGANGILAVDDAIAELNRAGYRTEGTFFEKGVGGSTAFDVSAKYHVDFAGSNGAVNTLSNARILSSTTESFCPVPGLCSFFGIMGMPAMAQRVTTLNLASLGGSGGELSIDDILAGNFQFDFLETTFADQVPATGLRRYHIPVNTLAFPAEGEGPLPTWADLPQIPLTALHQGHRESANFILDTGAQLSIISSSLAFSLGLDANGNGSLDDEAVGFQDIGGVGGTKRAPLLQFDQLRVPTSEGIDLVYDGLQVAVIDIDPTIDGVFGMNFLSSGWSGSLFGSMGDLADLLGDAGFEDLLKELGLGGLGVDGTGSPYGYFDKVHFDFRQWASGKGEIVVDLTDDVGNPVSADGLYGDLDHDGDIDLDDRSQWVHDVRHTSFGDSNLNGRFDSSDLVAVFTAGEYEDDILNNSTWVSGDWDGDCDFTTRDLVVAFQDGGYAQAAIATVPEPSSWQLCLAIGSLMSVIGPSRRSRR